MYAVKGNRSYPVTSEKEKNNFIKSGCDIYEDGKKIASGKGNTVTLEEHEKTLKELDALKEEHEKTLKELDALKEKEKGTKKDTKKDNKEGE